MIARYAIAAALWIGVVWFFGIIAVLKAIGFTFGVLCLLFVLFAFVFAFITKGK